MLIISVTLSTLTIPILPMAFFCEQKEVKTEKFSKLRSATHRINFTPFKGPKIPSNCPTSHDNQGQLITVGQQYTSMWSNQ